MAKRQLPPDLTHAFIDSCAFDPGGDEEAASRRILDLKPDVIVAHSVQKEIEHPNTPQDVKDLADSQIYTIETSLTSGQLRTREEIRKLVRGSAKPGKHQDDADHLFELHNYGGGYFITTDTRLLGLADELFDRYDITTIRPSEFEKLL